LPGGRLGYFDYIRPYSARNGYAALTSPFLPEEFRR
jgi:hypothetical protein